MLIWTPRARADLKAIHDRIAKDSRHNAKRIAHEIRRKADELLEPSRVGRTVPELNDPQLREMPVYSWRIIYHLREGNVFHRHPGAQAPPARRARSHTDLIILTLVGSHTLSRPLSALRTRGRQAAATGCHAGCQCISLAQRRKAAK